MHILSDFDPCIINNNYNEEPSEYLKAKKIDSTSLTISLFEQFGVGCYTHLEMIYPKKSIQRVEISSLYEEQWNHRQHKLKKSRS